MKKLISIITSIALASSLFGMPAMAFATNTTSNTEFSNEVVDKVDEVQSEELVDNKEDVSTPSDSLGSAVIDAVVDANSVLRGDSTYEDVYTDDEEDYSLQEMILSEAHTTEKTSAIHLNFDSYLPFAAQALDLTMKLTAKSASAHTQAPIALKKKANAENGATTSFYAFANSLPAGTYTLEIAGDGHATYTQEITLAAGKKATINLIDSLVSNGVNLECAESDRTVGLQAYGDYTDDGIVNSADSLHLVEVLANVSSTVDSRVYDLTGDGKFDLDDIQFFATTVKKTSEGIAKCGSLRITLDTSDFVVTPGDDDKVSSSDGSDDPTWGVDDGTSGIIENEDGSDIDKDNPVDITIETEGGRYQGIIIHSPIDENGDPVNMPTNGFVVVYPEDGNPITIPFSSDQVKVNEETGEVIVDFGEVLDVEKVVITITETSGPDPDKAEISYIEFIEDQDGLGDAFTLDIPANLSGVPEKSAFTLNWDEVEGATHYLLRITGPDGDTQTVTVYNNTYRVADLNGNPIINEKDYTVEVRAMGVNARSAWSDPITVTPTALVVPATPTGLTVTGTTYTSISVKWNEAEGAASYDLYYKEKTSSADPTPVRDIETTSYTIPGLKMGTEYEIYVVAKNAKGLSKLPSSTITVATSVADIKVPWYNLINKNLMTQNPDDMHIKVIDTTPASDIESPGYASDQEHLNQVIDGDYNTFFHQDEDYTGPSGQKFEFDKTYPINCFTYTTRLGEGYDDIKDITITIWDESGKKIAEYSTANGDISVRPLPDAENSFFIMFPETDVKQMEILMTREDGKPVTCSEVAFYESDHLDKYVDALFKDETQSSLNDLETIKKECSPAFDDFTSVKDIIDQLKEDIERRDPNSGERIPDIRYDDLKQALDKAEILADFEDDGEARDLVEINPAITPSTGDEDGLSTLQPIGVTVKPGDEIEIYVASSSLQSGAATPLRVVATQFYGHNASWRTNLTNDSGSQTLSVGLNKITIPEIDLSISNERGGALYIENLGAPVVQKFSVRVKGGIDTAALDLSGVTDAQEREDKCLAYINALKNQQVNLTDPNESTHKMHEHEGTYDENTCIANSTDIASGRLLLSLPATVVLKSIQEYSGSNNAAQMAKGLSTILANMDKNIDMLYTQKGMSADFSADELAAYGNNNYIPSARVNIRYMRYDTAKQLMYAGDDHIGIKLEYCDLLKDGKFSWNLLHEIGHILAAESYEIDEVTPSYFALLTTTEGPDGSGNVSDIDWPFTYEDVYEHLVKTTKVSELPDDLALALMWQLHLAFDGQNLAGASSTGKFDKSLYARMGIFERNVNLAPAPKGIALSTNASAWDVFIRLACAASGKNLTPFFDAWGIVYDTTTLAYAGQFSDYKNPIQYVTDQSSQYIKTGGTAAVGTISQAENADGSRIPTVFVESGSNEIKIRFASDINEADILGYQLTRNGEVCAFIKADASKNGSHIVEYIDYATQGNVNYSYSVCAVDKTFLTKISLTLGSVKVSYSGQEVSNYGWSAETNISTSSNNTSLLVSRVANPCEPFTNSDAKAAVDGNDSTVIAGSTNGANAQVTIRLKDEANIFGLKYVGGGSNSIDDFIIETSLNGSRWTQVATGSFDSNSGIAYFSSNGGNAEEDASTAHIYRAGHVRLTANGQSKISVSEIQLFGPLNDNINFFSDKASMGQPSATSNAGRYAREGENPGTVTIRKEHLAFVGDFVGHGNTDDLVLALFDQNGNQLIGKSIYRFVYSTKALDTTPRFWVYYFDSADRPESDCIGDVFYRDTDWFPGLKNVTVKMYRANGASDLNDMILVAEHKITNPSSYQSNNPTDVAPALNYIHNADTPEVED